VDTLIERLGISGISTSQVPAMATVPDGQVEAFRSWPLGGGPCMWLDALIQKAREDGRSMCRPWLSPG